MTIVRQNFSLIAGDDIDVDYGLSPPPYPLDITQANLTWTAYPQVRGVADKTQPVIVKNSGDSGGIVVEDPASYTFKVSIASADTMPLMGPLSGNYYYEIVIIDPPNNNRRSTPTIGTMTVIDTGDPLNVVAFKSMFGQISDVSIDDATLQTALDEAALYVDDTWAAQDVAAATFYLAGHFIMSAQMTSDSGGRLITQERIGQISVSYALAMSSGSQTAYPSLSTTSYGLMFLSLMRRNSPGIAVV